MNWGQRGGKLEGGGKGEMLGMRLAKEGSYKLKILETWHSRYSKKLDS